MLYLFMNFFLVYFFMCKLYNSCWASNACMDVTLTKKKRTIYLINLLDKIRRALDQWKNMYSYTLYKMSQYKTLHITIWAPSSHKTKVFMRQWVYNALCRSQGKNSMTKVAHNVFGGDKIAGYHVKALYFDRR